MDPSNKNGGFIKQFKLDLPADVNGSEVGFADAKGSAACGGCAEWVGDPKGSCFWAPNGSELGAAAPNGSGFAGWPNGSEGERLRAWAGAEFPQGSAAAMLGHAAGAAATGAAGALFPHGSKNSFQFLFWKTAASG